MAFNALMYSSATFGLCCGVSILVVMCCLCSVGALWFDMDVIKTMHTLVLGTAIVGYSLNCSPLCVL